MLKNKKFLISFLIVQQIISAQVNAEIEKINTELKQIEKKKIFNIRTTRNYNLKRRH